jgi:hypothetical protein
MAEEGSAGCFDDEAMEDDVREIGINIFRYQDLAIATNGFSESFYRGH